MLNKRMREEEFPFDDPIIIAYIEQRQFPPRATNKSAAGRRSWPRTAMSGLDFHTLTAANSATGFASTEGAY